MREKTKQSLVVKAVIKSNKRDDIIEIKPNKKAIKTDVDTLFRTQKLRFTP